MSIPLKEIQGARLRGQAGTDGDGEDGDSEEESDEEDIEEELGYISPLETVNPYVNFKQALTGIPLSILFPPSGINGL